MEIVVTGRPAAASAGASRVAYPAALAVPLFGTAMLLSGFLVFLVEPMVARMVLPILGGVPMVWNGCVVFFQIAMLAGYGYAFATSRWIPVRRHVPVHIALLASAMLVLPVLIRPGLIAPPSGNPLAWLLVLLAGTIGLPFFVLSTTASVLQHWLSRTDHPAGRDPYFLYVASNVGCLLALASYPVVIETTLTLGQQARLWTVGYGVFAVLVAACGLYAARRPATPTTVLRVAHPAQIERIDTAPLTNRRRARWVALAFVPSSLMLAVTSYISTDIAAVPLFWIVPLALYLLTFTLAFGRRAGTASRVASRALPILVVPLALSMIARVSEPLIPVLLLHLAAFTAIALNCHADLAADRPDAARLTEFYFWLSFGGMLGGLFNTLAAPRLFSGVAEYPLAVLLGCLLVRPWESSTGGSGRAAIVPIATGIVTAAALLLPRAITVPMSIQLGALALPAVLVFSQRRRGARFGWSAAAMLAAGIAFSNQGGRVLHATRTFFGVYRVNEDPAARYHGLAHGTTLHGMQALAQDRRREALTYYHSTGPFGQAWRALPSAARGHAIAAVGLGVGTLATYAGPDQHWTFFEIDPAIEQIARTNEWFTFLPACGTRCTVVTGDARISFGSMSEHAYDLIVLDAFSSDSIPLHLMTREAMDLYLSRLAPGGSILMHISNRHLRLAPIVGRLAADRGLFAVRRLEKNGAGWPEGKSGSEWVALSRRASDVEPLVVNDGWTPLASSPSVPLWTDDFSNILSVLDVR
jgi:hypothetical protein